jgi:hypothetical protein
VTEKDFDGFSAVVMGFAELRGKVLSPEAIVLFFRAMSGWSLDEFKAAAEHLLRTCEWLPTPFHFEELRRAGRPVLAEAWIEARSLAKAWRPNMAAPRSSDEFLNRVVESIGGYRAIAMCNVDVMGFLEKRFADAYESIQDASDKREAVPSITASSARTRLAGPRRVGESLKQLTASVKR